MQSACSASTKLCDGCGGAPYLHSLCSEPGITVQLSVVLWCHLHRAYNTVDPRRDQEIVDQHGIVAGAAGLWKTNILLWVEQAVGDHSMVLWVELQVANDQLVVVGWAGCK
jgi:hypothetical protein